MSANLHREINKLKKAILSLGGMVEDRFGKATLAVRNNDLPLALTIIDSDHEIDDLEVEVEEECLKVLALYQPVAIDLRFLIAIIKINNDLERVADQAVNICQRIKTISGKNRGGYNFDYTHMADTTGMMLKKGLDALVDMDSAMAESILKMDREVNTLRNEAYDAMKAAIKKSPDHVAQIINRYLISRHLERIGDHACNIAEEVIHMVNGRIIRHEQDKFKKISTEDSSVPPPDTENNAI